MLLSVADVVEDLDDFPAVVERGVVLAVDILRGRRRSGKTCGATCARRTTNSMSVAVRMQTDITANTGESIALSACGRIWNH